MEHVEVLAFILVNPFYLDVEHGRRINNQFQLPQNHGDNIPLVVLLNRVPGILE